MLPVNDSSCEWGTLTHRDATLGRMWVLPCLAPWQQQQQLKLQQRDCREYAAVWLLACLTACLMTNVNDLPRDMQSTWRAFVWQCVCPNLQAGIIYIYTQIHTHTHISGRQLVQLLLLFMWLCDAVVSVKMASFAMATWAAPLPPAGFAVGSAFVLWNWITSCWDCNDVGIICFTIVYQLLFRMLKHSLKIMLHKGL